MRTIKFKGKRLDNGEWLEDKSRQLIKQYGTDNKRAIRLKKMQQERENLERESNNVFTKN